MAGFVLQQGFEPPVALDTPPPTSPYSPPPTPPPTPPRQKGRCIPCFDGASDLPEADHPNFANFSFSFPAPNTEPAESSEDPSVNLVAAKASSQVQPSSFQPAQSPLGLSVFQVSPDYLTTSNQDPRFFSPSPLATAGRPSPDLERLGKGDFSSAADKNPSPQTTSSLAGSSSSTRSGRIRADDFWLKKGKQKHSPSPLHQSQSTQPAFAESSFEYPSSAPSALSKSSVARSPLHQYSPTKFSSARFPPAQSSVAYPSVNDSSAAQSFAEQFIAKRPILDQVAGSRAASEKFTAAQSTLKELQFPESVLVKSSVAEPSVEEPPAADSSATEEEEQHSLWPSPLEVRKHTSTTGESTRFLSKVQPLVSPPSGPTASETNLSFKQHPPQATDPDEVGYEKPDENTLRITRENVLKHLLSKESLREIQRQTALVALCANQLEHTEPTVKMSMLHPESAAAMTEHRHEAVRLAKKQEKTVMEKCKRSDQAFPGYTFEELIGKGSYGRVYKGRQTATGNVVAIKVLDIDEADFQAHGDARDEQIRDFNREIRILRQAQESGAPNMNQIIEALPVHSQLWMVCDYCPGGSVKTLMRATNDRLAERYIVVVARELAKALQGLHKAGIMHRDVKAANVLIHEEGSLQLCDFGVAGVLEQRTDKRRTFIGTLHWMPPELWSDNPEYSDEVDVWEYGVTLYECAMGKPPNSDLRERQQLQSRMRRLKQPISLPDHEDFGEGLRSLVKYTLTPDAKTRPSMNDVLEHSFLLDSELTHPTTSLIQLVQVYYQWLHSGGQRVSLFMPGGAVVTDVSEAAIISQADEWNFSTTETFNKRNSTLLEIPPISELSPTDSFEGEATPKGARPGNMMSSPPLRDLTSAQKLNFESRVKRGAEDLSNLFDQDKPSYAYKMKRDFVPAVEERRISDLPFRAMAEDRPTSIASNVIDLGDFDSEDYAIAAPKREDAIRLADAATIRAKRGDSKGPRDSSSTLSLTARRASSTDESIDQSESGQASGQEFAFPPKEWADEMSPTGSVDARNLTEKASVRDASRKTMEWTFATAMPASTDEEESAESTDERSRSRLEKTAKHATLDWSFSNAMAEVDVGSDDDGYGGYAAAKTTPKRRAPLLRTMTQPVTADDYDNAGDIPRPSTAHSEAYSESSVDSALVDGFDPFDLDKQAIPDPAGLDALNVSRLYKPGGHNMMPGDAVPYAATVEAPAPYMLGRPARIGEEGHPGPTGVRAKAAALFKKKGKDRDKGKSSSSSTGGRPSIGMPEPFPPSDAAMAGDANPAVVERELSRLLGGLEKGLSGASQALAMVKKSKKEDRARKKAKKEQGKGSGDEWEDEA